MHSELEGRSAVRHIVLITQPIDESPIQEPIWKIEGASSRSKDSRVDRQVFNHARELPRQQKAPDEVDIDDVPENGTEAERHVLNKAYEATHVGDPLVKSLDEVTKAADRLDRYVAKSMVHGETFEAAHDRLAEAATPSLQGSTRRRRRAGSDDGRGGEEDSR